MSDSSAAAQAVEEAIYHLQQTDVDAVFTLLSGLVTLEMFSLLAQLLLLGVVLAVVFVVAIRRF